LNGAVKETVKKKSFRIKYIMDKYGLILALIVLCLIMSLSTTTFLQVRNIVNVIRQISIISILAIGVTYVILTGGIDLSLGSLVAVAGVSAATFAHPDTYPLIVPIAVGILVGVAFGLFNGIVITRGGVAPFITTLGVMTAARGTALIIAKGRPISNLSDSFNFIGGGELFGIPFPIIIFLVVFIVSHFILSKTKFGRYIYAIGGNEEAARASGVKVKKVKTLVYVICSGLAGLAGVIQSSRIAVGQPSIGEGYELDAIAAVVIGGTSLEGGIGTVFGTIIGSLIIGVLNNGLDLLNVPSYYQQVVKGLIIIGAVLLDRKK
jgi:ribose/xylose/arabinose/galactoside ABC-type transport system permease subunit